MFADFACELYITHSCWMLYSSIMKRFRATLKVDDLTLSSKPVTRSSLRKLESSSSSSKEINIVWQKWVVSMKSIERERQEESKRVQSELVKVDQDIKEFSQKFTIGTRIDQIRSERALNDALHY